jgi:serine protease Do
VIVSVNDVPVKDARELARKIAGLAPEAKVKIGVIRKGAPQSFTVTLGTLPNERQARADAREREIPNTGAPRLGLGVAPASSVAGAGSQGVVVTDVDQNGPAGERGVKIGDVILEVGGKSVSNSEDVRKALEAAGADGKRTVLLRVKSGDATRFVAVPLSRA